MTTAIETSLDDMDRAERRLYARHAAASERGRWSVYGDVAWHEIDEAAAWRRPELLEHLRAAALIEAYHPVNLGHLRLDTWDDVDAGVVFSLEAFEGFTHFHALRMYLEAVGYEPAISDDEIVAGRRGAIAARDEARPLLERLVEFMLSEHLAAYFFRRIGEQSEEPVLARLMALISADEVRHAQSASDLLAKRIATDPRSVPVILDAAVRFRHYGNDMVGEVPVAMAGDDIAIQTFAKRIERLCGVRIVDHLKGAL
jgi:hypothetical protein